MSADAKRHTSVRAYVISWVVLLGLTVVTYAVSRIDLGAANVPLAIVIAAAKSALVGAIFMHLWEQAAVLRLVVLVTLFYVVVLTGLSVTDLATRESGRAFPLGTSPNNAPVGPLGVPTPDQRR